MRALTGGGRASAVSHPPETEKGFKATVGARKARPRLSITSRRRWDSNRGQRRKPNPLSWAPQEHPQAGRGGTSIEEHVAQTARPGAISITHVSSPGKSHSKTTNDFGVRFQKSCGQTE